jgi:hypothetical protein
MTTHSAASNDAPHTPVNVDDAAKDVRTDPPWRSSIYVGVVLIFVLWVVLLVVFQRMFS